MPDWMKYAIGVILTLFTAALTAWAGSIKIDTEKLVNQGELRETRVTIIEQKVKMGSARTEKIEQKIDKIWPAQIRLEEKIDRVLEAQQMQAEAIKEMKEHDHQR